MFDAVRFWLDKGVDGFRLDIFGQIMKDPGLPNNPVRPHVYNGFPRLSDRIHTENTPDNVRLAKELRAVCEEYPGDRVLLGEVFGSPTVLSSFIGDDDGLQLVFLFDFLTYRYDAEWFRQTHHRLRAQLPGPAAAHLRAREPRPRRAASTGWAATRRRPGCWRSSC